MEDLKFKGLGVALATPFTQEETIDFKALQKLIDYVIKGGADYLVILGTTAETPTLTPKEREEISLFIKDNVAGRLPLVIGIGGNNTANVVDTVSTWDLDGYSAILSVAPYYNKPTQEGLYRHFRAISEASPLPLILYNVPGRTGVNLTANTTLRLAMSAENIIGIKEASGKLDQCQEIIKGCPEGFHLISGNDSDTASIMAMGGCGVISVLGNALPQKMKALVSYCLESDFDNAASLQMKLNPLISHLFEEGNPAGVKAILSHLGLTQNIVRLPLVTVSDHVKEKILEELSEIPS